MNTEPAKQTDSYKDLKSETLSEDRAPLFGKWKYFYVFVVLWLVGIIAFFILFNKWFS